MSAPAGETLTKASSLTVGGNEEFHLSVLVDFIDDALEVHYTPQKIEQMMTIFRDIGVRRVYWQHYGGLRANWSLWTGHGSTKASRATIQSLEGMPIRVAIQKARKAGLEIYAVIRPYETGISETVPAGSAPASQHRGAPRLGGPAVMLMNFPLDHPEMRIQRRMTNVPANVDSIPIRSIRLFKSDAAETRITADTIEIWTSSDNYQYQKKDVAFTVSETVEPAGHDFVSHGKVRTAAGTPIRVLTLNGLDLKDRYILVTTTFDDSAGDFQNCGTEIIRAYDDAGIEIPTTIATSYGGWKPNRKFRTGGLSFDTAHGSENLLLDCDNSSAGGGFVAICRGKNEFLPGALSPAYPEVRNYWMEFVRECVDAGVDGIDMRVQNHSTWTDEPFAYGFNPPVVDAYQERYGVNILNSEYDAKLLADLRGEYYTAFLRSAAELLHGRGMKLQVHINTDLLSPKFSRKVNPFSYPRNVTFDWEQWLTEGIADEATLRSLVLTPEDIASDSLTQRVVNRCRELNVPLHYNRYLTQVGPTFNALRDEIKRIHKQAAFQSFILYEGKRLVAADGPQSVKLTGGRYGTYAEWKQLQSRLAVK